MLIQDLYSVNLRLGGYTYDPLRVILGCYGSRDMGAMPVIVQRVVVAVGEVVATSPVIFQIGVRVVNARAGTAAKVRVIIESRDGTAMWGTVGVSENVIEASWQALVDSVEYKLEKDVNA